MSIVIRLARKEDVKVIGTLVEQLIAEATTDRETLVDRSSSIVRAVGKKEIFMAEENGDLVGFIHGVLHEDIIDGAPNLFITAFFVVPERRNVGIGSRLLDASIRHAIKNHATEIESSTTSRDARRLFERFGFIQQDGEVFLELNSRNYLSKP